MARLERLELPARCLEGSCSILTELQAHFLLIGEAGFEPATSCSQSRRAKPSYATPRIISTIGAPLSYKWPKYSSFEEKINGFITIMFNSFIYLAKVQLNLRVWTYPCPHQNFIS